jgi:iodotyrosine deiodinase
MGYRPVPLRFDRLDPDEQLSRSRAFLELMRTRRSVRRFSAEPVPYELIENAIATAGTAPSGAHQQPWSFVVVGDTETKRLIRDAAEAEERRNYEGRMSPEWIAALERLGTTPEKPHIEEAPYLIVVFEQPYGPSKEKHYYVKESVGIACGLLLASLHAAGLATLTHTPSPMGFLARLLERPPNERAYLLIPVGYPASEAVVPDLERKPLDEILVVHAAESGRAPSP